VEPHNFFYDRQADAVPLIPVRSIGLVKFIKNTCQSFLRDLLPAVRDRDLHLRPALLDGDTYRSTRIGEFHRVIQEVDPHLLQEFLTAHDFHFREFGIHRQLLRLPFLDEKQYTAPQLLGEVVLLLVVQRHLIIDPGQCQYLRREIGQTI